MILGDVTRRNAALYGDRVALVFEKHRFTHRQLAARIYRAANALLDLGVRQQERVAMLARNCNEVIEIFGAGDYAGFISVNINHRLSQREVEEICADAGPSVLFFETEFADQANALRARHPGIRHFISIGGKVAGAIEYEEALAAAFETEPRARASPGDIAHLIYTSGTTGRPKGVMFDHRTLLLGVQMLTLEGGATDPVTGLVVMPLFHSGGRLQSLSFLLLGGTVVLHRAFDAAAVLEAIQRERCTAMHVAPIMVQRIVDLPGRDRFDTSSLSCVRYASAPMPVPVLRRAIEAFGSIFNQVYGMTECIGITMLKAHEHLVQGDERRTRRLASAGQPSLGTQIRIVRPDGSDAELGEIGEILIRSEATMQGYWNNHLATCEAIRGNWLHSQDIGRLDEDGFLYILDRKKDMIVSGGENIYSWEVEEALRHHAAVSEVAVIAIPDPEWGESVKACVVVRQGARVDEQDLIEHCRVSIASYKKPRSVDFLPALPRLANGKVDKKALRAPYWAGRDRQVS
jgi:acyl-CoA synthetase (AMP-forming)/AMP-acid ligase II